MEVKKIFYTKRFFKELKQLPQRQLKELKKQELIFRYNCFDQRLKTHKLKGELEKYWAFSITYKYRIVFRFIKEGEVLFHRIGTHSIYN